MSCGWGCDEPKHTWMGSVQDLYHHAQHLYSTILSHTANCCGRYKLISTISCINHNSHPPCSKLAQVVALSSPPFKIKLSVWLPPSCNAATLIAKATTQLKEVAFHQPIIHYQKLCCYQMGRLGFLSDQRLRVLVPEDRMILATTPTR